MLPLICLIVLTLLLIIAVSVHVREIAKYKHIPGVSQILPSSLFRIPILAPYFYLHNQKAADELSIRFSNHGLFRITAFNQTYLIVNTVEAVRHIVMKNYSNYPKPSDVYYPVNIFGINIVSASGGELHRKHRRILQSAFEEKHLKYLVEVSNHSTDSWMKSLVRSGSRIELNSDMIDVTMDIISKAAFGSDLNIFCDIPNAKHSQFDKSKYSMSFYDALNTMNTHGIIMRFFVPECLRFLPIFNKVNRAIQDTRRYIKDLADSRRGCDGHMDLLSLLVQSNENPSSEATLTEEEVISDAVIMLDAGHETSATTLGWLMYEVAKDKDAQRKLHEEIDRTLGGRDPTYEDIDSLTYIVNVIKETLRLHPPVQVVPKTNLKKDKICGYTVPRNSIFALYFPNIHQNEEYWPDAHSFKPERFNQKHDQLTFLSFSRGPRKCIGYQFSIIEITVVVAKFFQKFNVKFEENIDPKTFEPKMSGFITMKIAELHLLLEPRSATHSK